MKPNYHGKLYREIKRKLYSGRKDDPATHVEIRIGNKKFGIIYGPRLEYELTSGIEYNNYA